MTVRGTGRAFGGLLLGGLLFSCTPHENPPPVLGSILGKHVLRIDSGGSLAQRSTVPVLAVHVSIKNPGPEVRLLGYRYETSHGIVSEALMDRRLVEASRSRLGRLVRLGLPTVFPANSTTAGWVFFKTNDDLGRLHLSLRDVYGRFSALYVDMKSGLLPPSPGKPSTRP